MKFQYVCGHQDMEYDVQLSFKENKPKMLSKACMERSLKIFHVNAKYW